MSDMPPSSTIEASRKPLATARHMSDSRADGPQTRTWTELTAPGQGTAATPSMT